MSIRPAFSWPASLCIIIIMIDHDLEYSYFLLLQCKQLELLYIKWAYQIPYMEQASR